MYIYVFQHFRILCTTRPYKEVILSLFSMSTPCSDALVYINIISRVFWQTIIAERFSPLFRVLGIKTCYECKENSSKIHCGALTPPNNSLF